MKICDMSFNILNEINREKYLCLDVDKNAITQGKLNELLTALHDTIDTPKGIVPDSVDKFYCQEYYKETGH